MENSNFIPDMPKGSVTNHKSHWLLVGIVITLLVTTFVVWGYINKIGNNLGSNYPVNIQSNNTIMPVNSDINTELNAINTVELDSEFKSIDQDLNSL